MDNILIWIIAALLLWQGKRILQFLMFLYYKFQVPEYHFSHKDEIDIQVLRLFEPYEKYLLSQGFEYKYALKHKSMIVGSDIVICRLYYCHEAQGIHAFLETTPYKGSLDPVRLSFDTIYKSKKICTTENGVAHFTPVIPKDIYFYDHYLASWENVLETHIEDRAIDGEKVERQCLDREGLLAYISYSEKMYIDAMVEKNIAIRIKNGYRYRASFALWKFSKKSLEGYHRFSKILKNKAEGPESIEVSTREAQTEGLLMQMEQVHKSRGSNQVKKRWFLISLFAFVVLFSIFGFSFSDVLILLLVLLVHELGHFLAMRYFGYTDTNILFLPFGAVTTGIKTKRTAFEEYIVSLMGPLPGILIGIGIMVYQAISAHGIIGSESYLDTYAMMSLLINYVNLLPIYPLDGGRILHTLLLLRYPKAQFYFYLIGLLVLVGAMLWMQDPILLIFVAIMALGLKQSYLISELLQTLFKRNEQEDIDADTVASTLMSEKRFYKESLASKAQIAQQALMLVDIVKPSKVLIIFGMGLFLMLLSPPIAITLLGINQIHHTSYDNLNMQNRTGLDKPKPYTRDHPSSTKH